MQDKVVVQLVVSERGDFWMEDLEVLKGETLREAINRRGYQNYNYIDVDIDDPNAVKENLNVRIRLME